MRPFKRNTILLIFVWVFTIPTVLIAVGQTTIFIDPSYTGSIKNGSLKNPYNSWDSVSWASNLTYLQKAGTNFITNGGLIITGMHDITLGSYGTGKKPLILSSGSDGCKVIDITSCFNMAIKGLEIKSATGHATAAISIDGTGSANNLIEGCIIRDVQWGIRILTCSSGNRISNCEVLNTQNDGIFIKDVLDIEISYCKVYNVNLSYHINPDQSYSSGDNIQIASMNNMFFNIHHNVLDHSSTGNKFCFIVWGNNYSGILENNIIIGNSSHVTSGIYLHPTKGTINVRYNYIKACNYGIYSNATDLKVYYNIFSRNNNAIEFLSNGIMDVQNNVFFYNITNCISSRKESSVVSKNNIFYITESSGVYYSQGVLISDYNIFNTQSIGFLNGKNTLVSWQAFSGQDKNSYLSKP